jgi:hypothetical protein
MTTVTLVKFFKNEQNSTDNKVISRTLLKVALIDKNWQSVTDNGTPRDYPQAGEFWKVRILKETCVGMVRGCFIVEPIEKIGEDSIVHLVPGMYDEQVSNGVLVVVPRDQNVNWILPLPHKKYAAATKNVHAVVIILGGNAWSGHDFTPDSVS